MTPVNQDERIVRLEASVANIINSVAHHDFRLAAIESTSDQRHKDNLKSLDTLTKAVLGTGLDDPGLIGAVVRQNTVSEQNQVWLKRLAWLIGIGISIGGLWLTHLEVSGKVSHETPPGVVSRQSPQSAEIPKLR
jgi:hypothetical protein